MSSQQPDHARVIPLRPAATVTPAPRATPHSAAAGRGRPVIPGVQDRTLLGDPRPAQPAPVREPLWRHIVGDVLRRERLEQGLRLKDVAGAAQISMPYLSEIERGRKEASSEVLAAAARALGLGLADLLALAQAELARFAQCRRARTAGPAAPEQGFASRPDLPAPDDGGEVPPAGGRVTPDAQVWPVPPPVAPLSPPPPGWAAPPRIEMSLAA